MSTHKRLRRISLSIQIAFRRVMRYILGAANRIFSPTDDNYLAIGVQPYEGDPADGKSF